MQTDNKVGGTLTITGLVGFILVMFIMMFHGVPAENEKYFDELMKRKAQN